MFGTSKSTTWGYPASPTGSRDDLSWYGSLAILAACLIVLATLCVTGCSGSSPSNL